MARRRPSRARLPRSRCVRAKAWAVRRATALRRSRRRIDNGRSLPGARTLPRPEAVRTVPSLSGTPSSLFLPETAQKLSKSFISAEGADLHRRFAELEPLRDFCEGQVLESMQHDRNALIFRKLHQSALDGPLPARMDTR